MSAITIGTGTSTTYNAPYNNYYKYSTDEMIYPASAFGFECYINSIAFYVSTSTSFACTSLKIYMAHKSTTTFASTSDYIPYADMTLVYSGAPTIGASTGWETFTLDTPFYYNGVDNLVIIACRQSTSYTSALKYAYTSTTGAVLHRRNDSTTAYADASSTSYSFSTSAELPNIQLEVEEIIRLPDTPQNLRETSVDYTSLSIAWDEADNATGYIVYEDGAEVARLTVTEYTKIGLLPNESHTYAVAAYNDAGESEKSDSITVTTPDGYIVTAPEFISIVVSKTTVSTSELFTITVEVEERTRVLEPHWPYSGTIYSGLWPLNN